VVETIEGYLLLILVRGGTVGEAPDPARIGIALIFAILAALTRAKQLQTS
jgi:hypothetical protein